MLKLMKYEFRKGRTSTLVMVLVALALIVVGGLGHLADKESWMVVATSLSAFYLFAAYAFTFLRGVMAYSGEMRTRSGYLLLMTPHSTTAILFAKLLYTLVMALLMLFVSGVAIYATTEIMMDGMNEIGGALTLLKQFCLSAGIPVNSIVNTALFILAQVLVSMLSIVAISYLSVTLSATVLQEGKARGFVTGLIFLALCILIGYLSNLLSPSLELYEKRASIVSALIPNLILHLINTAVCTVASAQLLRKKVSL